MKALNGIQHMKGSVQHLALVDTQHFCAKMFQEILEAHY